MDEDGRKTGNKYTKTSQKLKAAARSRMVTTMKKIIAKIFVNVKEMQLILANIQLKAKVAKQLLKVAKDELRLTGNSPFTTFSIQFLNAKSSTAVTKC